MEEIIILMLAAIGFICTVIALQKKQQKILLPMPTRIAYVEKRQHQRLTSNRGVRVFLVHNGRLIPGWVLDCSQGGICLSISKNEIPRLAIGKLLRLKTTKDVSSDWFEIRVENMKEEPHTWRMGCSFLREINDLRYFF